MPTCECGNNNVTNHVNAFVDLSGIPYLLAEYLDSYQYQQVDRSLIKSEIIVDQSEAMRAVIDVSIDDIGKRASDGYPAIVGNTTKHSNLLRMISDNHHIMNHQLNVLRRGIVIRVDYQLENYNTGQVIRSATESFKIPNRSYFLDINPRNTNDNAIIVNFCDTLVSTINEFTHGQDPMMIRITNIHLSYEMVKVGPHMPRITQSLMNKSTPSPMLPTQYCVDNDIYHYHTMMQNRHLMPGWDPNNPLPTNPNCPVPNSFSMFNRFYRFDNNGADIILHDQEIDNPMTKTALIPCGIVRVNRTFMINPGSRLIFKFCIWKNDVTIVTDTTNVALALRAPIVPPGYWDTPTTLPLPVPPKYDCGCVPPPPPSPGHHDHSIYPDYETMLRMLHESRDMEYQQNQVINQLTTKLAELAELVQSMVKKPDENPGGEDPGGGTDTPDPGDSGEESPDAGEIHDKLQGQIDDLEEDVDNIQDTLDDIPNVLPIDDETISTVVEENSKPSEP